MRITTSLAVLLIGALAGCDGAIGSPGKAAAGGSSPGGPGATSPEGKKGSGFDLAELTPDEVITYVGRLAPPLVGRVLNEDEQKQLLDQGGAAIESVISGWVDEEAFPRAARTLIEQRINVSGVQGDVDFDVPGRLVAHVVEHQRPWSEILTSTTCYDAADAPMACDTGAPYTAGVLTTRGYLISRRGRFNLTRASTMLKTFACRGYPMEDELQPRLPKEKLIPMFRALTAADQTDPKAKSGFGNGAACYTCHGQFGAHAQVFVKFDETGLWQKDADGVQDPDGELGRSLNGLFTSHMYAPEDKASEASQVFGKPVDNLAGAAKSLAESPTFVECSARNVMEYVLLFHPSVNVPQTILADIAEHAREGGDPTFGEIVISTLTYPEVVRAAVKGAEEAQP